MSENIQSISQGTYTIGQTSATNFVAGPGIKIDEPSAGTVRIGNDETVLYDGDSTPAYSANMTEAATNFERLRLEITPEGTYRNYASFIEIDPNANGRIWDLVIGNGESNAWLSIIRTRLSVDGLTLTTDYKKAISFGSYTSTSTATTATSTASPTCILKVVGINRISGSNA